MMSRMCCWRTIFALGLLAVAGALIMGAARQSAPILSVIGEGERIVPRVEVIQFDNTVARFDTTTGEIHRYQGDLDKPNVRGVWVKHVRGVSEQTSGLLQLQKPRGVHGQEALFLVDAVTGDTWLLRRRGSNADWEKIEISR